MSEHAAYATELTDPVGVRFALAEWDLGEETVQRLLAANVPWAVRRCGSPAPENEYLWPDPLTESERSDLAEAAVLPWTATPSKAGTRRLRASAWQASLWRSGGRELLLFEES